MASPGRETEIDGTVRAKKLTNMLQTLLNISYGELYCLKNQRLHNMVAITETHVCPYYINYLDSHQSMYVRWELTFGRGIRILMMHPFRGQKGRGVANAGAVLGLLSIFFYFTTMLLHLLQFIQLLQLLQLQYLVQLLWWLYPFLILQVTVN